MVKKTRVLVEMCGGTIVDVQHDNPDIALDVAFLEDEKYSTEETDIRIGESFLYTHVEGELNQDYVREVFTSIAEKEEEKEEENEDTESSGGDGPGGDDEED